MSATFLCGSHNHANEAQFYFHLSIFIVAIAGSNEQNETNVALKPEKHCSSTYSSKIYVPILLSDKVKTKKFAQSSICVSKNSMNKSTRTIDFNSK